MPASLLLPLGETGLQLYAILSDSQGRPWNGVTSAFEAHDDSHWADYAVAAAELGTSGQYSAAMPSAIPAGGYGWTMFGQQGGAPALSDSSFPVGAGSIEWDGSAEAPLISRLSAASYVPANNAGITAIQAKTINLPANPAATGDAMALDMAQSVPLSNPPHSLGDALNAARAMGFGKWALVGTTLTLYAADGSTPVRAFTVDDPTNPTIRT
jgi:hypothetical protein